MDSIRVLLVCAGNVCRSPMAQAVGDCLAQSAGLRVRVDFDSAGTNPATAGGMTDPRALEILRRAGYDAKGRRARCVGMRDFEAHDLILAMDIRNLAVLRARCPSPYMHKLRLFLDCASGFEDKDVPDPYFGDTLGFERVLELCEAGIRGLLWSVPELVAG